MRETKRRRVRQVVPTNKSVETYQVGQMKKVCLLHPDVVLSYEDSWAASLHHSFSFDFDDYIIWPHGDLLEHNFMIMEIKGRVARVLDIQTKKYILFKLVWLC